MKIITTVGTSLLTNAGESANDLDKIYFDINLFDFDTTKNIKADSLKRKLEKLERHLKYFGVNSCAETASIAKIDSTCDSKIHFLCTETTASYLCGLALKNFFLERAEFKYVQGLQVQNQEIFRDLGVPNLLTQIEQIAQNGSYWDDIVLNITGGYKAIIPIMTLIGQIRKLPIFYIFGGEEENKYELIELPRMPIGFQTYLFESFLDQFEAFGEKGNNILNVQSLQKNFIEKCFGFLEISQNFITLNPIGRILWWNYQQEHFYFFTSKDIFEKVSNQKDILSIIKRKLSRPNLLNSKTERKGDHYVFDDGNNNNRIFYFLDSNKMYIYKTFQNEEKAKEYISEPFQESHRNKFINIAKRFHINL
jgi:putative CRISPR-associated protein (TIGR02619 family)